MLSAGEECFHLPGQKQCAEGLSCLLDDRTKQPGMPHTYVCKEVVECATHADCKEKEECGRNPSVRGTVCIPDDDACDEQNGGFGCGASERCFPKSRRECDPRNVADPTKCFECRAVTLQAGEACGQANAFQHDHI